MTMPRRGSCALCVGLLLSGVPASARAVHRVPFRATVTVRWGEEAGSDAFRGDLGRALAQGLGPCFSGVDLVDDDPATAHADLHLAVVLFGFEEDTRYDDSIAGALQPGEPAHELRRVAHVEVAVDASLETTANAQLVQRKHLVANISRRPVMVGEDPQAIARGDAIDRIVSDLEKAFCASGDKLEQKIRAALAEPGAEAPPPR